MPRPKKTPEPAKRGPGRPRGRKPVDPRVRISPEALVRLTAMPGGTVAEHVERAVLGYLDGDARAEELAAHREGRASTLREIEAVIERMMRETPGRP